MTPPCYRRQRQPDREGGVAVLLLLGLLVAFVLAAAASWLYTHRYRRGIIAAQSADVVGDTIVRIDVDATSRHAISPYIYGINFAGKYLSGAAENGAGSPPIPRFPLDRLGGNRFSAYNWETNYSNAGNDYKFSNDTYLSESVRPGAAVSDLVSADLRQGRAALVTIPMLEYVAGDLAGPLDAADSTRSARLKQHFKRNRASKGAPFVAVPDTADGDVYEDEFLNLLRSRFPESFGGSGPPIFLTLDNEPDLWSSTHEEVESKVREVSLRLQTYDGFVSRTIEFARALKRVAPGAAVFGPGTATWAGMATLGRYPVRDPRYGGRFFLEVYLDLLLAAERSEGRRLLDVLDVHWYPEMQVDGRGITDDYAPQTRRMVAARLQAPRSLWDCGYVENSWVNDAAGGPVCLLPRLEKMIASHYPGTKIAITEYNYGGLNDISGAIAQADVLGIFGREGVFAAALWPEVGGHARPAGVRPEQTMAFAFAAFDMFLNYDGAGSRFGEVGVSARTSSANASSAYASLDDAGRLVLVALNKSAHALPAEITVHGLPRRGGRARVYTLTAAAPIPVRQADLAASLPAFRYLLPPSSVTTLVLDP